MDHGWQRGQHDPVEVELSGLRKECFGEAPAETAGALSGDDVEAADSATRSVTRNATTAVGVPTSLKARTMLLGAA